MRQQAGSQRCKNESIYHGGVMQYRLDLSWPRGLTSRSHARVSISNVCYLPGISFCTGLTYRPRKVAHNYLSLLCDQRRRVSRNDCSCHVQEVHLREITFTFY